MEPWKKWLIGAVIVVLLVYAPHTVAAFLQQAFHSLNVFFSSFHWH